MKYLLEVTKCDTEITNDEEKPYRFVLYNEEVTFDTYPYVNDYINFGGEESLIIKTDDFFTGECNNEEIIALLLIDEDACPYEVTETIIKTYENKL